MALLIAFRNISNLADVSDYEVSVWINNHEIDTRKIVTGHTRSLGYQALVKRYAQQLEAGELKEASHA